MAVKVIIQQDGSSESLSQAQGGVVPKAPRGADTEAGKPKQHQLNMNALLIDYGKQILNEGINVGVEINGDYLLRDNLNTLTDIATDILLVAKGGPVGAVAVAFKYGKTALTTFIETDRAKIKADMLRKQAGNVANLGGRYSND